MFRCTGDAARRVIAVATILAPGLSPPLGVVEGAAGPVRTAGMLSDAQVAAFVTTDRSMSRAAG
ncbi:MAG: hypothetical protein OEM97_05565 [Acidimicrobiia bacterium]|nr:hypothetical protein [Acidimicrobiia bacterium]